MRAIYGLTCVILALGLAYMLYAGYASTHRIYWYPAVLLAVVVYALVRGTAGGWAEADEPEGIIEPDAGPWRRFVNFLMSQRLTKLLLPVVCIIALVGLLLLQLRYERWGIPPPVSTVFFFGSVLIVALAISYVVHWRN